MVGSASGVSGVVEYDADVHCFNDDEHEEPQRLIATEEVSDEANTIFECPECGVRRAVNLHVAPLRPDNDD